MNGGTLTLARSGTFGATSGSITVNGGTLDLAGRNITAGAVRVAGGTIQGGGLTGTSYDGQSGTVSAALGSNGASLVKTTSGLLALTGANSYSGGTQIAEGTLRFGRTASMPASGLVTARSGAVLAVNVGGAGEFSLSGTGAGSVNGLLAGIGGTGAPVLFEANSYLGLDTTNAPGGSATFSSTLSASGPGLVKLGAGTLTLTANNTNSVGTRILGGTLALGSGGRSEIAEAAA